MKKIIALVVALVMMAAIAVPAFAEDNHQEVFAGNSANLTNGTVVKYGTTQTYTVTIPAQLNLNAAEIDVQRVEVSDYKLAAGKQLEIIIGSGLAGTYYNVDDYSTWWLVEADEEFNPLAKPQDPTQPQEGEKLAQDVKYNVFGDGVKISRGGLLFYVDASSIATPKGADLYATTEGTSYAGCFTDTITFTAKVVSAQDRS